MEKKLNVWTCTICGKGWPLGMSGAVSSIKYPGYFNHFPNCPKDAK